MNISQSFYLRHFYLRQAGTEEDAARVGCVKPLSMSWKLMANLGELEAVEEGEREVAQFTAVVRADTSTCV